MTDNEIIDLYFSRSPDAISETEKQYGTYLANIAYNILGDRQDSEECVSDTYLAAWEQIPPLRPHRLGAFLGRITRNISVDKWRKEHTHKRGGGQLTLAVDELDRTLSGGTQPEAEFSKRELIRLLEEFLKGLKDTERRVFLCRYWYMDSISDIAVQFGFSQSKVKSMLLRTRTKLRRHLNEKGGYHL